MQWSLKLARRAARQFVYPAKGQWPQQHQTASQQQQAAGAA